MSSIKTRSRSWRAWPMAVAAVLVAAIGGVNAQMGSMAPESGTVEVNGANIWYKSQASGEPIVVIHGYPLNGELFKNNRDALSRQYRVITVNLRGFRRSTAPDEQGSIETYAQDVGLMDQLDIERAIVGGMSMGGITALEMYRRAPERVSGLILIDTVADPAPPAEQDAWRGMSRQAREEGVSSMAPVLLPRMLTGVSRLQMPGVATFPGELVMQASLRGAIGGGEALASRPDLNPVLPMISVPTLILVGREDNVPKSSSPASCTPASAARAWCAASHLETKRVHPAVNPHRHGAALPRHVQHPHGRAGHETDARQVPQ